MIIPIEVNGKLVDGANDYNSLPEDKKEFVDDYIDSFSELFFFLDNGISKYTIPSKDVRNYCFEQKISFTTRQKATLIFNNPFLLHKDAIMLYEQLIKKAAEENDQITKNQLEQRLEFELTINKMFFEPEPQEKYCYAYSIKAENWNTETYGYFSTWEKAKSAAEKTIKNCFNKPVQFIITKYYIDSPKYIFFNFDQNGQATNGNSINYSDLDNFMNGYNRFEDEFVKVPYPFRRGDFIKCVGDDEIGVFALHKDEKDYLEQQNWIDKKLQDKNFKIDVSDMSTRAEYFYPKNKSFYHEHPFITTTEYAVVTDETPDSEILQEAAALIKGEGSIETLQYLLKKQQI